MEKHLIKAATITIFILLIPLIAMQFTTEVDWNLFDFVVAGALIFGTSVLYQSVKKGVFVSFLFFALFFVIGVLNVLLVHPVPGILYLLFSLIYLPQTNMLLNKRFGFSISPKAKIVLALLVIWPTLAVGDLAEILGL